MDVSKWVKELRNTASMIRELEWLNEVADEIDRMDQQLAAWREQSHYWECNSAALRADFNEANETCRKLRDSNTELRAEIDTLKAEAERQHNLVIDALELARAEENEACAKTAEKHNKSLVWPMTGAKIAAAIRARVK